MDLDLDIILDDNQEENDPTKKTLHLPENLELKWKAPENIPSDRHLTTDIIPVSEFLNLRLRLGGTNSLAPRTPMVISHLKKLKEHPLIAKLGTDLTFEDGDMEPDEILCLEEIIEMFRPQSILELGSGISTLVLANKLQEMAKKIDETLTYIAVDDNNEQQSRTLDLAGEVGIAKSFKSIVLPGCNYRVGEVDKETGKEQVMPCYEFDEKKLHAALQGKKPDMIIINGPTNAKTAANASLAKTLTMPILSLYSAPGALIAMSRAYADPEIFALEQWQKSGAAHIIGIKAVGKGLMIGVTPS